MRFEAFARLSLALKATSGRLALMAKVGAFLRGLEPGEVRPAVLMLTGRVRPPGDARTLDVSGSTVWKAVQALAGPEAVGRGEDLGAAVAAALSTSTRHRPPVEGTLSLLEVHERLLALSAMGGRGSASRRQAALQSLYQSLTVEEAEVLTRIVVRDMRHGADEGVVLEAVARLIGAPRQEVSRALQVLGDLSEVAEIALRDGRAGLERLKLQYFRPLKPMLAQKAESVTEALATCGGRAAVELKLDGARLQIHRRGDEVRLFTRRLSEVTGSLPDVVERVRQAFAGDCVAEGELVPMDVEGRTLPFQELMRRFRRVHDVEEQARAVPVRLVLFDLLALGDTPLLDHPLEERWSMLAGMMQAVPGVELVPRLVTDQAEEGERYCRDVIERGQEGVMVKDPRSRYTPGVRGKAWLKVKRVHTLDLVIVAAEWGYGRRREWLSNYHLAAHGEDGLVEIGKTFKGLTDAEFEEMTRRLLGARIGEDRGATVRVEPQVVVEVAYADIQKSPTYACGYALRFARIVRVRDDRSVSDIDTLDAVRQQFERQQSDLA